MNAPPLHTTSDRAGPVNCPRCNYSFEGLVSGWKTCCPVDGQCSECGLSFRWRDIFVGDRLPGWFVETGDGFWSGIRRTPGTIVRMLPATSPWQRLRLEMFKEEMRLAPYFGWLFILLLSCYLAIGLAVGTEAATNHREINTPVANATAATTAANTPTVAQAESESTLAAAKVFVLGLIDPFALLPNVGGQAREYSDFRVTSMGRFAALTFMGRDPMWTEREGRIVPMPPMVQVLLLGMSTIVTPLVFTVLPYTRRAAKVKRGHLARLAFLSVMIGVIFWLLLVLIWALEAGFLFLSPVETGALRGFLFPLAMIAFAAWWASACRRFLRLASWPMVAASVLTIGILLPVVVVGTWNAKLFVFNTVG